MEPLHVTPRTLVYPLATKDVSVCTCILRLENKEEKSLVAYKVKTNAVKRYVVRPNLGILLPGKTVEVACLLNYDRVRAEEVDLSRAEDRFQVLSIALPVGTQTDELLDLWQQTPAERIMKKMVKVKFVAPNLVKTVTPHKILEGKETDPSVAAEPDLEQAKQTFKQEMAASKVKKEVRSLKEERDALKAQLAERDEKMASLERQVLQLKAKLATGTSTGTGGGGSGRRRGCLGLLLLLVVYVMVALATLVLLQKYAGFDVLAAINPAWQLPRLEQRFLGTRHLAATPSTPPSSRPAPRK